MYGYSFNAGFKLSGGGAPAPSYLVDDYSPAAAYSLRKLSSTATNAIRVRRSNDNAETDIGFSDDDLDTASLLSFVGVNSAFVVKWYNQGTGGATYDTSQVTASSQPRIVDSGNIEIDSLGNTSLTFRAGGFSRLLVFGSGALYNNKSYGIGFTVYENNLNTRVDLWGWHTPSRNLLRFNSVDSFTTANRHELRTRRLDSDSISVLVDTVNFPTGVKLRTDIIDWANSDAFIRRNGVQVASSTSHGTAGSTSATDSYNTMETSGSSGIGQAVSGAVNFISEVIFFNTDQNSNISAIETNINDYYGIY